VQVPKPYKLSPILASPSKNKTENTNAVKVEGKRSSSTIIVGDKNVVQSSNEKIDKVPQKIGELKGGSMYPYDKRKLEVAFTQLMKCRTAGDFQIAMQLPDTSEMGLGN